MLNKLFHRRLPDFEIYDEINLKVIPRYKTSELSGDEWRQSIHIDFMFKGMLVKTEICRDMKTAIMLLGSYYLKEFAIPKEVLAIEKESCDQPSCPKKAIGRLKLKKLTDSTGDWLDMKEQYAEYYRQFCSEHIQRGDCGREDTDDNYTPMDTASSTDSTNKERSPSHFGGIIDFSTPTHKGETG